MLFRSLPGILNGVECISEYKLHPLLLYRFMFQEKKSSVVSYFLEEYVLEYLPNRYWSCIQGLSFLSMIKYVYCKPVLILSSYYLRPVMRGFLPLYSVLLYYCSLLVCVYLSDVLLLSLQ